MKKGYKIKIINIFIKKSFFILILFISILTNSYSAQNITTCGNSYTSPDNYFLNDSLDCNNMNFGIEFTFGSDGSTLNCQGHEIRNVRSISGAITIENSDNIQISNCIIKNASYGIRLDPTDNTKIENVTIDSIDLLPSLKNGSIWTISDIYFDDVTNTIFNNVTYRYTRSGNSVGCSNTFNNVRDQSGKYHHFINSQNQIIDGWTNISSLTLCNADNSIIRNLNLDGLEAGIAIDLMRSNNNITFEDITIRNYQDGFEGYYNTDIYFDNIDIQGLSGTAISSTQGNSDYTIENSILKNNEYGVIFSSSSEGTNTISNSEITNNQNGIFLSENGFSSAPTYIVEHSTITSNNVSNIYLGDFSTWAGDFMSGRIYNNTIGNISKIQSDNWNDISINFEYNGVGNTYYNASAYNGTICFGGGNCDTNATVLLFPIITTSTVSSLFPIQGIFSLLTLLGGLILFFN
jgi:parallel beta-helix repeat protein